VKVCICIDRHSIFGFSFMVDSVEECKEEDEDYVCEVLKEEEEEIDIEEDEGDECYLL